MDGRKLAMGGVLLGALTLCAMSSMVVDNIKTTTAQKIAEIQREATQQIAESERRAALHSDDRRLDIRMFVIRSQLAQAERPVIIMGDSIAEAGRFPSSVCGHDIINAGIGGATAGGYLPFAKQFLTGTAPAMILVALGTNDSGVGSSSVESGYNELLNELTQHTATIALAGIAPFEMTGALAAGSFDQNAGDRTDAAIRKIAAARNLPFVDLRNDMRGEHLTNDGIHLSAAGYRQWQSDVLSQIRSSLGCTAASVN